MIGVGKKISLKKHSPIVIGECFDFNAGFVIILLMDSGENKEILEKQEETLILVKKIWRAEKCRRLWTVFRYVIYIGILFGAFYFLTPFVEKLTSIDLQKILEQVQLPR